MLRSSQGVSPPRRRASFWMPRKKPMAQATFSWPFGPIHLERHQGVSAIGRGVCAAPASMPLPPGPPFYGDRQLGSLGGHRKGAGGQRIGFRSMTAAAEFPVTFRWYPYRLEARLLGWWGSSSAQRDGGRVRAPAPTAENGPVPLARQSEAQSENCTNSKFCLPKAPVARWDFRPITQILRAGWAMHPKGIAAVNSPGALVRQTQAQNLNRITQNFCTPRAPVGPE